MKTRVVLLTLMTAKDIERGLMSAAAYLLKYQDGQLNMAGLLVTLSSFVIALPIVVIAQAVATLSE